MKRKRYKGLETDQVRQFKQLQDENARLKRLVAELREHSNIVSCNPCGANPDL